jgi:membrane-bound ClpP family serine protease
MLPQEFGVRTEAMDTLALAYGLIAVGLVLMAAELLLPTHGALFGLGLAAELIGVVLSFGAGFSTGLTTLTVTVIVVPVVGAALVYLWPKTPLGKRLFLRSPDDDEQIANMPAMLELERLRGRFGRTVSPLRPCGVVEFDGKRVDTMTEGEMVEADHWVRCVDIKAGRVIVRPVAAPPDLGNIDTALFGDLPRDKPDA